MHLQQKHFTGILLLFVFWKIKLDEDMHQKIAREMNLSETAFIRKLHPTDNFTQTVLGELTARRAQDGIILDLPLYPTHPQDFHEVDDLIKTAIGDTLVQDIRYSPDTRKLLVRLSDTYKRPWSAHAVLSSYWSQQLGKKDMHAFQCSCRGGELEISLRPDGRVDIRGGTAIVLEGTLTA
ncbi:phenazine biosynthesis-like domain-containing protein isoform X1 [Prionailurus iriomotensis]